jgi:long-chain fatty acid transport protein
MSESDRSLKIVAIAIALSLMGVASTFALGFRNPDQDARATAQGEAFVAQADDASAAYYNPAGLVQLTGTQLQGGTYLLFRNIDFTGASSENMSKFDFLPHFYAATDFGLERWRFGLAFNTPYGLSVDWGGSSAFQYIVTTAELTVLNISPTAAYQINDQLSIGAGLNVYYGDTLLKFNYSPALPGSRFQFDGDGTALGATVGVLWRLNEQHALAVVYRSPFSIDLDGDARTANAGIFTTSGPASATFDFPQSVVIGYAIRPTRQLKLEVNIDWTNWDVLNTVRLKSQNPVFAGDPRATIPFHWKNSFFYEYGAQYELDEKWTLLGGYIFSQNTVPDSTFSPLVPDSDRHVFSVGVGYRTGRLEGNLTYQYSLSEARTVPASGALGASVAGKWESDAHAIMLTSSFKF